MTFGEIHIGSFLCDIFIGIYPEELLHPQKVEINFSFAYDWKNAVDSDLIENAIDYAVITENIKAFVSQGHFNLLETLTSKVAKRILQFSPKIESAKVCCKKISVGATATIELAKLDCK